MVEPVEAPTDLMINGQKLTWSASKYVICYVVKKNGTTIAFVKADAEELAYEDSNMQDGDVYTVQGVSEYGMLSALSTSVEAGVSGIKAADASACIAYRSGDEIVIKNISAPAMVNVYSLTGAVIMQKRVSEESLQIKVSQSCIIRIVSEKKTSVFKML